MAAKKSPQKRSKAEIAKRDQKTTDARFKPVKGWKQDKVERSWARDTRYKGAGSREQNPAYQKARVRWGSKKAGTSTGRKDAVPSSKGIPSNWPGKSKGTPQPSKYRVPKRQKPFKFGRER